MNTDYDNRVPIKSSWNEAKLVIRGQLTDKKIAQYAKRGFYDEDFREARRELWAKRKARREGARQGSFIERDGRLIYSPL